MIVASRLLTAPLVVAACMMVGPYAAADQSDGTLKVCADPSNLPLSNDKGQGYENKIAEALASDLKLHVTYTFFPQRIGFIRNTLRARNEDTQQYKCDLIIGVPKDYELTATTVPYLHSTYELIFAARPELAGLHTAADLLKLPREKRDALRIGIFTKSPGADWVLKNGMVDHAVSYTHQNGDVDESPARTIERDLANGTIDAAIMWGPMAAMLVEQHKGAAKWYAVPFEPDPAIKFDYEISMGLRNGEKAWKETLDGWITSHRSQIDSILLSYNIPLVDTAGHVSSNLTNGSL